MSLDWVARETGAGETGAGDGSTPGDAALAAAIEAGVPDDPFFGWTVGEQSLPTRLRGHWVTAGVPKEHIMFCGYWRAAKDAAH